MALNSRQKGKAGELEAAKMLRDLFGWDCGRSVQHSGTTDSADLRVNSTPGLWFEVKRVQALNLPLAMAKAVEQAGRKTAVVLHRRNHSPVGWMLTIRLEDLPHVCHAYTVAEGGPLAPAQVSHQTRSGGEGGQTPAGPARDLPTGRGEGSDQDNHR